MSNMKAIGIANKIRTGMDLLCEMIEDLPASEEATALSVAACELRQEFEKLTLIFEPALPVRPGQNWDFRLPKIGDIVKSVTGHEVRVNGKQKYPELSLWMGRRWVKIQGA